MSKPQTVSQAYLLGISEGRAAFRALDPGDDLLADARAMLATSEALLKQGFSGDMREALRGERDFWRAKVARLSGKRRATGLAALLEQV